MEKFIDISIMIVGAVLLAIIVSIICGNRKLHRHKECCRKDPHVPGMETNKVLLELHIFISISFPNTYILLLVYLLF